jgi:hypothetical protein
MGNSRSVARPAAPARGSDVDNVIDLAARIREAQATLLALYGPTVQAGAVAFDEVFGRLVQLIQESSAAGDIDAGTLDILVDKLGQITAVHSDFCAAARTAFEGSSRAGQILRRADRTAGSSPLVVAE